MHLVAGTAGPTQVQNESYVQTLLPARLQAYLDHGVTTVKSLGDPTDLILAARDEVEAGVLRGPRILAAGPALTTPGGLPVDTFCVGVAWCLDQIVREVASPAEGEATVDELAADGVDAIKFVNDGLGGAPLMPPATMAAIVDRAHLHGLPATGHASVFESDAQAIVDAGADGVEHMFATPLSGPTLANALLAADASYVTTLTFRQATIPAPNFADCLANTAALHAAGVRLVVGTDTIGLQPEGATTHAELALLVAAGLTPTEALRAATVHAADHLGRADLGRLEPGALADLVLVGGDPLADITAVTDVRWVVADGTVVKVP